jgi:predicted ATP-binding protein involved in virulence
MCKPERTVVLNTALTYTLGGTTMLTRLKVSGFKNLVDVDVRFGPFTCIAGPNGVGKSNLFDAIAFLSALAEKPLIDAAFMCA